MTEGASDEELVTRARRGGPQGRDAFDVLVRRYQDWLVSYLMHLLRAPAQADDAAQEAFLRAYLSLDRLANPARFRPWLRTIATRTAFNLRRGGKTRRAYEATAPAPLREPDPESATATAEAVGATLGRMSYAAREILVLRYVEELSLAEVAAVLDIGGSAAKMRLLRAREEFTQIYERQTHEPT